MVLGGQDHLAGIAVADPQEEGDVREIEVGQAGAERGQDAVRGRGRRVVGIELGLQEAERRRAGGILDAALDGGVQADGGAIADLQAEEAQVDDLARRGELRRSARADVVERQEELRRLLGAARGQRAELEIEAQVRRDRDVGTGNAETQRLGVQAQVDRQVLLDREVEAQADAGLVVRRGVLRRQAEEEGADGRRQVVDVEGRRVQGELVVERVQLGHKIGRGLAGGDLIQEAVGPVGQGIDEEPAEQLAEVDPAVAARLAGGIELVEGLELGLQGLERLAARRADLPVAIEIDAEGEEVADRGRHALDAVAKVLGPDDQRQRRVEEILVQERRDGVVEGIEAVGQLAGNRDQIRREQQARLQGLEQQGPGLRRRGPGGRARPLSAAAAMPLPSGRPVIPIDSIFGLGAQRARQRLPEWIGHLVLPFPPHRAGQIVAKLIRQAVTLPVSPVYPIIFLITSRRAIPCYAMSFFIELN